MEHKNTLEGNSGVQPVLPILEQNAIRFITKFTNEYYKSNKAVQIPSAWLFERGVKESFNIQGVVGIKFYSAINADMYAGAYGALTFILVPVISNQAGELVDLVDNNLFEFSQLCPDVCNIDINGTAFPGFYIDKAIPFVIPKSFYFPKSFFDEMPNQDTLGVRLYSITDNNRLELRITPVEFIAPNYRDLVTPVYSENYLVCQEGSTTHCDTNSSLYIL